ncbi:alkaline phosphatase [Shewanella sp. MEBiC00475]|uniref:alkaline phosphatase n=1 Tax=Shewanella sp. MEBiC00475 TaxID=2575361 RepID=UPI0010C02641|nr:alkaline phosphatase [Shewanella sp. MEBiC00475]
MHFLSTYQRLISRLLLVSSLIVTGVMADEVVMSPVVTDTTSNNVPTTGPSRPTNIIIMIGDGMGPAYTTAYRYYKDNPETEEIEQTVFDRLLVGMASTYPAPVSGYVTDSAASATALSTGVKSYNGAIAVDTEKRPLTTLMEKAKSLGLSTGVAVTSQVNHATPAAFLAHNESRRNYIDIAEAYLTTDADVILGGGQQYFTPTLLEQFSAKGYQNISEFSELESVTTPKVLGLFADVQLPWVINDQEAHKLSHMTQKALDLLSQNKQGFVLLVEGSLIDWAGHSNDIATAMGEMDEFASAIEVVEQFVRQRKDTLMVVTADHNTGGLSVGAHGKYEWHPEVLHKVKASPDVIASQAIAEDNWQPLTASLLGFTPSETQYSQLQTARMQGNEPLTVALRKLIDIESNTGWTSGGHTAMDVQVFAAGPGARLFSGHQDNIDIAIKMFSLLPQSVQTP